jgi:hypothetical protein
MVTNNLHNADDHANNASDNPSPQLAKDEKEAKRRKKDKGLQFKAILKEMVNKINSDPCLVAESLFGS